MGAAGKNLSNKDVLQLIMDVLETNVGPAPAPPESEDEERELLLTSTHHQWLEQVQDALEEKLMADPSAQASSSTVAAASSSTAPDDAASSDSSSDLEVAMEPDESAGPETTIRCKLSGELASRFVASSEILGSSAPSDVTVSYQPPIEPTVIGDGKHVQRTMTREHLNNSYGLGLQLVEALGWKEGSTLGTSRAATSGALKTPLQSATQLDRLSAKKHFSLDTYVQDNPIVTESGALVAEPFTKWDVMPYPCGKCSVAKWPAYRQPGHFNNSSGDWLPTKWVCSDCAQATPNCMNCILTTWNGFNVGHQESGRWLCAKCWTDGEAEKHHKWGPWFRCREIHHPQVNSVMPHDVRPSIELHSYDWIADQAREGDSTKWSAVKEYSPGKKALSGMEWRGEIPSEDKCSAEVDRDFLLKFLKSRPYRNKRCDALFDTVVDKGEGWLYYGMKLHSVKKALVEKHLLAGWLLGFHASRMECATVEAVPVKAVKAKAAAAAKAVTMKAVKAAKAKAAAAVKAKVAVAVKAMNTKAPAPKTAAAELEEMTKRHAVRRWHDLAKSVVSADTAAFWLQLQVNRAAHDVVANRAAFWRQRAEKAKAADPQCSRWGPVQPLAAD